MPDLMMPPEFDPQLYRETYTDLAEMNDGDLRRHWEAYGVAEGRIASHGALRENFVELAARDRPILEIGPFFRPTVCGPDVYYFDVLNQRQLNERSRSIGHVGAKAPHIHYVSPTGDLSVVDRSFTSVISSHCIEHQPCLIKHLHDVGELLQPGGRYFLIIPDKRYCFDAFIPSSTIADIIQAHEERRRTHTLASVIEHRALTTHNIPARHWRGDSADPGFEQSRSTRALAAIEEYRVANGSYIDVHAWQFTPDCFGETIAVLAQMEFIYLDIERVYSTPATRNEFCAVLRRPK